MQKQKGIGVFLIALGALLLLGQFGWVGDNLFLYFLAVGFFAVYMYLGGSKRYGNIGFLIPSMVLLAIALFADLERLLKETSMFSGGWFFIFLAMAFFAVYLLHTRVAGDDAASKRWPLYPAGGLAAFGVFIALIEAVENWRRLGVVNYIFPVALILIGLYVIFGRRERA